MERGEPKGWERRHKKTFDRVDNYERIFIRNYGLDHDLRSARLFIFETQRPNYTTHVSRYCIDLPSADRYNKTMKIAFHQLVKRGVMELICGIDELYRPVGSNWSDYGLLA